MNLIDNGNCGALSAHYPLQRQRPTRKATAHRPSVALIIMATVVQIIAMAAVLGTLASAVG